MSEVIGAINEVDERYDAKILKAYKPASNVYDGPRLYAIRLELDNGEVLDHSFRFDINWDCVRGKGGNMLKEYLDYAESSSAIFCELIDLGKDHIENGTLFTHQYDILHSQIEGQTVGLTVGAGWMGKRCVKGFFPTEQPSTEPTPD